MFYDLCVQSLTRGTFSSWVLSHWVVLIGQFIFCIRFWEVELANDRREGDSAGGEAAGRLWESKKRDVFVENEAELEVQVSPGGGEVSRS